MTTILLPFHDNPAADTAMAAAKEALASMEAFNRDWSAQHGSALRFGIALHIGEVVYGNIGAPDRVNYTIVGDTVNTTQRIEMLGRQFADGDAGDVVVHLSDSTERQLDGSIPVLSVGSHELKGRAAAIGVFRLDIGAS